MALARTDYLLSQLDVLEAESIHIMREVAAEFERPVLLFSGGKDSIVMLALAERAFWPARIPFPVMHVDTGHNFAEVLEFRDRRVGRGRRPADRRLGPGLHRRRQGRGGDRAGGPAGTGCRPPRCSTRSRTTGSTPSSAARAGMRRRPGRRSGCSPSATSSASGTRRTSARSCGTSTTPGSGVVSTSGSSRCPTGPSSTSGTTSPGRSWRSRRSTSPTPGRCSSVTASCWPTTSS